MTDCSFLGELVQKQKKVVLMPHLYSDSSRYTQDGLGVNDVWVNYHFNTSVWSFQFLYFNSCWSLLLFFWEYFKSTGFNVWLSYLKAGVVSFLFIRDEWGLFNSGLIECFFRFNSSRSLLVPCNWISESSIDLWKRSRSQKGQQGCPGLSFSRLLSLSLAVPSVSLLFCFFLVSLSSWTGAGFTVGSGRKQDVDGFLSCVAAFVLFQIV